MFWLLVGGAVWLASQLARKRFTQFFCLDSSSLITLYVSNLWNPTLSKRSEGFALSMHESNATQTITKLISSAQLRTPDIVRGLVDGIWLNSQLATETVV